MLGIKNKAQALPKKEEVPQPIETEEVPDMEDEGSEEESESEEKEESNSEIQEVSDGGEILVNHEQRIQALEAAFFRLKNI